MQKPDPLVVDLNTKMFVHHVRASEACRRANVNASTWSRWAAGGPVHLPTFRKVEEAVDSIVAEQEDGQPAA